MKMRSPSAFVALFLTLFLFSQIPADDDKQSIRIPNENIDFEGFLKSSIEVQPYREKRRISVETFVKMSREDGTIILDSRSREKFESKHIKGAVHLNFSDFTKDSLAKVVPSKNTRILIYCNNNFRSNSPAFPLKLGHGALNIPTFVTLYQYGYRNIYEMGPVIDESDPRIELDSNSGRK